MRPFRLLPFLLGAALAAGCGGSDQTDTGNTGGNGNTGGHGGSGGNTGGHGGDNTGGNGGNGGNTGGHGGSGGNTGGNGGDNTGGNGGNGGNGGGTTTTTTCGPPTQDASKLGADCAANMNCPDGYVCQSFSGIVVSYYCTILCDQDCECPTGTTCEVQTDKGSQWMECKKP